MYIWNSVLVYLKYEKNINTAELYNHMPYSLKN